MLLALGALLLIIILRLLISGDIIPILISGDIIPIFVFSLRKLYYVPGIPEILQFDLLRQFSGKPPCDIKKMFVKKFNTICGRGRFDSNYFSKGKG
jgi:hypothetical protein